MFGKFTNTMITQYAERGEGTGGASKILSGIVFPILAVLAVPLLKDQQYIPLLVLAALMWTRLGTFVLLIGLIYFAVTRYWIGVEILIAYFIVSSLSAYLGWRNIRRLLVDGKPTISPFEGMPEITSVLILECFVLALALFTGGWVSAIFWGLLVILEFFRIWRYWFRMRARWSRIHYSLMFRYAHYAGEETARSVTEGFAFDDHAAIRSLLKSVYPRRQNDDIQTMVYNAFVKIDAFSDRDLIRRTILRHNASIPSESVEDLLDKVKLYLRSDEGQKLIPCFAVAEVVESVFGEDERGEYLLAVIQGKAY